MDALINNVVNEDLRQVRVFSSFPLGLCLLLIVSGLAVEARRFGQGRSRSSGSTRGKRYLSQYQSHGSNYNRHWNNPFRTIQVANAANEKLFQYRGLRDITCVPAQMCQTMYGSSPEHFTQYGYVSPEQYNCLSLDGVTLCITDGNANPSTTPVPVTTTTSPTTSKPSYQLPCVEAYLCKVSESEKVCRVPSNLEHHPKYDFFDGNDNRSMVGHQHSIHDYGQSLVDTIYNRCQPLVDAFNDY
ncbi:hypothetical protein TCAL_12604 [Tigriopus californicus]|uniref:Uncharacterized protein n=1 Tax=Tigriopus californicus TaxID=6832 RepID=A0A553PPN0_TIGCA|nr:hypothetical protein TCAL_12604 [Tigriopus californicus]|eukprot:TCALIF_12604-PA protein Name:"Protein of unknown function" AED:0.26 eAED:0.26 QI:0/0/0/0.33/1/1/3/0/242